MGGQGSNAFTSIEETVYTEDIPATSLDKFLDLQADRFRTPIFRIFHTELEAVYEEKNRTLDNDGNKVAEAMDAALLPMALAHTLAQVQCRVRGRVRDHGLWHRALD